MAEKIVDARGMACPLPVIHTKQACEGAQVGDLIKVLVDNEIAVQNLERFAGYKGYEVLGEKVAEKEYEVTIHITEAPEKTSVQEDDGLDVDNEDVNCTPDVRKKGMLVVLSANVMGGGEEKLGKALMKAFVFALTKQDVLPETILCYNTGAYLTCEDSDSLEDLKNLEAEGVQIFTCGTCLDFYGIKEKLAVGAVTNMYDIVEKMEQAKSIIKP